MTNAFSIHKTVSDELEKYNQIVTMVNSQWWYYR